MKLSPSLISKISSIIHAVVFLLSYLSFLFSCRMYLHSQDSVLAFLCFTCCMLYQDDPFQARGFKFMYKLGSPPLLSSEEYSLKSSKRVFTFLLCKLQREHKPSMSKTEFSLFPKTWSYFSLKHLTPTTLQTPVIMSHENTAYTL